MSPINPHASKQRELAGVLLISPGNCEAATGLRWRLVREHAERAGVAILRVGSKPAICAAALMKALEQAGVVAPEPPALEELGDDAQRAHMRAALGLRVVGGSR